MAADKKDFFISYTVADQSWAKWIASILMKGGYSVILEDWDLVPDEKRVSWLNKRIDETQTALVVLSSDYIKEACADPAWAAAFLLDPNVEDGRVLPVRVEKCEPTGPLEQIGYLDLVGLTESSARDALLNGERSIPPIEPPFPGSGQLPEFELVEDAVRPLPFPMRWIMGWIFHFKLSQQKLASAERIEQEQLEANEYVARVTMQRQRDQAVYKNRAAALTLLLVCSREAWMVQLENLAAFGEKATELASRMEDTKLDDVRRQKLESYFNDAVSSFFDKVDELQRDFEATEPRLGDVGIEQRGQSEQDDTSEQAHSETSVHADQSSARTADSRNQTELIDLLDNMNRDELRAIAARLGIRGRSKMSKEQLKEAIFQRDPSAIRRAMRRTLWDKLKFTIGKHRRLVEVVGAVASIGGLAMGFYTCSGSVDGPAAPVQPSERVAGPTSRAAVFDVFIKSATLSVDITIDERPYGTLHRDKPSTTVRLSEGKHHLVATKGDLVWEEWFNVDEENRIRLIPSEDAFRRR